MRGRHATTIAAVRASEWVMLFSSYEDDLEPDPSVFIRKLKYRILPVAESSRDDHHFEWRISKLDSCVRIPNSMASRLEILSTSPTAFIRHPTSASSSNQRALYFG